MLEAPDIKIYQSLIGALQWAITLGRFDIAVSTMVMSRFCIAPHAEHMERVKRIIGYLRKHTDGAIRFRTGIPDNENLFEVPNFDWMHSVYGNPNDEDWDEDMYPLPLGNMMRICSFVDTCLGYCKVTGKSITGIIHLVNQTPVKFFSNYKILLRQLLMVPSSWRQGNALNRSENFRRHLNQWVYLLRGQLGC